MRVFWAIALGAALGGVSRHYLSVFIQQRTGADFPTGTLIINVTGSFVLGFIVRYALHTDVITPETRAFLTTGFCGGYTTFSTFSLETARLLEDGEYGRAGLYVGASVAVALLATFLGFAAAQRVLAVRGRV
ncbi:MAG: fluoride efflux transporter CrcB [bacterium]